MAINQKGASVTRRVVGILGGMGPEATILLQQKVLATVQADDDADHLPLLIDMNPRVPSRIAHLIDGTGADPTADLVAMAKRLETAGATALAMPCNTAHHYVPGIEDSIAIPFLNMVKLSIERASQTVGHGTQIGILASPAVRMAGVFDLPLEDAGFSAIWPRDEDQLLGVIRDIKASGPSCEHTKFLTQAANDLASKGASLIFVACSEFSLVAHELPQNIPVIDTMDVLADAIHTHIKMK